MDSSSAGLGKRANPLLQVDDVSVCFATAKGQVQAVDGISFRLSAGEILGLMGESGSGKSTLARALLRTVPPPGTLSGTKVLLEGVDLLQLTAAEMHRFRGRKLALIAQEPGSALNPLVRIDRQLIEGAHFHLREKDSLLRLRAARLLEKVGIARPAQCLTSYPHELSVGMQQRVLLAMTLLCEPALVIADEPTAALDAVTESQVLDILRETTSELNIALILISHDWKVIRRLADRVVVMKDGRLIEEGTLAQVGATRNDYVRGLLSADFWRESVQ